jgi:hypothetical protein
MPPGNDPVFPTCWSKISSCQSYERRGPTTLLDVPDKGSQETKTAPTDDLPVLIGAMDVIKTKVRPLSTGRTIGGIPFMRGSLAYFLRNRFYIGQVKYKTEIFGRRR